MKVHSDRFINNIPSLYPHTQKVTELTIKLFELAEDCAKLPFFFPLLKILNVKVMHFDRYWYQPKFTFSSTYFHELTERTSLLSRL